MSVADVERDHKLSKDILHGSSKFSWATFSAMHTNTRLARFHAAAKNGMKQQLEHVQKLFPVEDAGDDHTIAERAQPKKKTSASTDWLRTQLSLLARKIYVVAPKLPRSCPERAFVLPRERPERVVFYI